MAASCCSAGALPDGWRRRLRSMSTGEARGLAARLATAARHLAPEGTDLWAQVAPGNAASVRAFLAAGFVPVGAEILLAAKAGSRTG